MNTLVFDIETVPDIAGGRRLYGLDGLDDAAAAEALFKLRRQETGGSDFIRHSLQRIVCISAVLRTRDGIKVWSLGDEGASEAEIIQRFFAGLERYTPTLVSWNGSGFDLPVLHYRALIHGVQAPAYWDQGEYNREAKFNNYLGRFHSRHIDVMDLLAGYQARAVQPLDQVATLLGFPGKMGMDGGQVWPTFLAGDLAAIRHYCETDVLNTYLVFLRFQFMRGQYDAAGLAAEFDLVKSTLAASEQPHLLAFLAAWQEASVQFPTQDPPLNLPIA
ncbi:MAG: 3'-5' exonuclease [Moraxellaceae bacterium]|nr:3'-5' exonuclease [Moraxellaceae bacterium]MDP1776721.1 3'-5' exonuclease [Moraxellaceae bacterium]MDZ4298700.1 3'-5' exonuclease [Moraxellaceae bacterium]MDZ4387903.1 3'-5' exonuclease [Moraxellaceae bacterium]